MQQQLAAMKAEMDAAVAQRDQAKKQAEESSQLAAKSDEARKSPLPDPPPARGREEWGQGIG